jgi:predicted porin
MNKKLIALALAALPVAAMADVTIYGTIKGGFENVKEGDTGAVSNVTDLGSRIGFKGQEDLGNGLKAIWQVENGFGIDGQTRTGSRSGTFANRQSFIGMTGNFGTVRLGNLSNYGDSDMEIINLWENDAAALGLSQFTVVDGRNKNSIRYDSPVFAGFDFTYLHSFDETAGVSKDLNNVGLGYSNGPVTAKYNFQTQKDLSDDKRNKHHRVEATYSLGNLLLGAGYSNNTTYDASDDKFRQHDAAVTVAYSIGAFTPKFSYDHGWDVKENGDNISESGYNQFIVGVDYALSKRTTAGLSYGKINAEKNNDYYGDQRAVGLQLLHKF